VRAGNVIGGGDWSEDRITPDCINALENCRDIIVRNPKSVRPWQHVLEPLSGYLLLCSKIMDKDIQYSGAWNFGPEPESNISVGEMADMIIRYWGSGKWVQPKGNSQDLHEAKLLNLDISKARFILGWRPNWNVERAIEKTVEWYKNYKLKDAFNICMEQIEEYSKEMS
jgi:CDP-glucose 4,6-dehydratase